MPYILYKSNGKILANIADGSINASSTSLTFVGKNYAGYGEILNQNIVKLLENFSNTTPPANPLLGQLWYDSLNQSLTIYNGTNFKSLSSFVSNIYQPSNSTKGDFWFNENEQKLYFYNGSAFVLIGPQASGFNGTSIAPALAEDVNYNQHYVLNFTVTDDTGIVKIIATASRDEFTLAPTDALYNQGYTIVKQGITLPTSDATNGNSISNSVEGAYYFWGTAATSRALVYETTAGQQAEVHYAEEFLLTSRLANSIGPSAIGAGPGLEILYKEGLKIGDLKEIWIHSTGAAGGYASIIANQQSAEIDFQVQVNNANTTVLSIVGASLVPGTTNAFNPGVDLGTNLNRFSNLYVNTATTNYFNAGVITVNTATVNGLLTGNVGVFNGITATQYLYSGFINAYALNSGFTTATGLLVTGDELVQGTLTVNGLSRINNNLIVTGNISAGAITVPASSNLLGNLVGNVLASIVTATNLYVASEEVSSSLRINPGASLYTGYLGAYDVTNGTGVSAAGLINGQWSLTANSTLAATFADLAERYHADGYYDYGTVLVVGGLNEVTTTDQRANPSVAGIVSRNPAYMMNQEAGTDDTHPYIALKGRVFCKVVGIVHKGDRLVTSTRPGFSESFRDGDSPNSVIGISLEDNLTDTGMIEIKV